MPSLTSLRKYQRQHGIVIHHTTHKGTGQSNTKKAACGNSKKQTVKKISQVLFVIYKIRLFNTQYFNFDDVS